MQLRARISVALLAATATVGVASREAYAQDALSDPLARQFKETGDEAMRSLRYEDALDAYEHATQIEQHPSLLFNRARALQALQRYPEALDHFEAFRAQAPSELLQKAGKLDELILRLRMQITTLHVRCNVRGATLLMRGHSLGVTPFEHPIRVNAGTATVLVQAEGYLPHVSSVELKGGEEDTLELRLIPRAHNARVRIRTAVPGAMIYVDGERLGTAPAESTLREGRHTLRVQHADYQTAETTIELRRGESRVVDVPLERRPGVLKKWWFWAGSGVLVAAGIGLTVAALTERQGQRGDIAPGVVSGPLHTF